MKKITFVAFVLYLSFFSIASAQTAGLKVGLWEVKTTKQVMDGKDMTAQMNGAMQQMQQAMASMSAEQKKQMEKMVSGMGVGPSGAVRICISAAMAEKNQPMVDKDGQCAPAKVTRSGNRSTFEFNCTKNGRTTAGTGVSNSNGDTISTSVDMTMSDAKGTHTMQNESVMTFVGSDCQGVVPADQLAGKNAH